MRKLRFGFGAAVLMAACVTACSGNVSGGNGNGGSGSGAGGTGGGGALSLADQGALGDACAPNDGPALDAVIGAAPACNVAPGAEPHVRFYAYPGSTMGLAAGQSWSFDQGTVGQELSAEWFPDGAGGNHDPAQSGSIEVLSVSATDARVRYQFLTAGGESYSGEATVLICPSTPVCG
jgi:hypothetical protein